MLRDRGEAEDAVQETFLYLYRRATQFDQRRGPARAWIVQVAVHRALDRRLYLARRGFYLGTETDSMLDTLEGAADVERETGARLNRLQLERAFRELPELQRRTLQLFYFEGMELDEIAAGLNQPLGNIRHYYYRGLERLRKSALIKRLR
jgi:RNA polymerase sigma-70 factor, ECF subfamily